MIAGNGTPTFRFLSWLLLLGTSLHTGGCSKNATPPQPSREQMAQSQRQRSAPVKRSLEYLGRSYFGSSFRSARQEGTTALLEFAPKQEGTSDQNFRRIFGTAAGVIPSIFSNEEAIQKVRLAAVDADQPGRRLVVFSVTRDASDKMDWRRNLTTTGILKTVTTEYVDPSFRPIAAEKGR